MKFDEHQTRSPLVEKILRKAREIGRDERDALLLGEQGTGKLTMCSTLREESSRAAGPFIVFEAGQDERQAEAAIRASAGGTLVVREPFLLPYDILERLGRAKEARLLVISTRGVPEIDAHQGRFERLREGLLEFPLHMTPLRKRLVDLPLLVDRFAAERAKRLHRAYAGHAPDLIAALGLRAWPGNLTELRHVVEDAVLFARGPRLTADDLDRTSVSLPLGEETEIVSLEETRRAAILRAVARCGGNQSQAAKKLQIARTTLLKYIQAPK